MYVVVGYMFYSQVFCFENLWYFSLMLLFVVDFLPSYLFTALSNFSWICWIAPNNVKINQLFGTNHGLAMSVLSFDWGQVSASLSPLAVPWWAGANIGIAVVLFYWIIIPILYVSHPLL
jgi:hypothetical protein